jgi:hypothetical protein
MTGLYHYNGMKLYYLSEDEKYAIYQLPASRAKTIRQKYNPFRVYAITHRLSNSGWTIRHKLLEEYADLYSGVCYIRQQQGFGLEVRL